MTPTKKCVEEAVKYITALHSVEDIDTQSHLGILLSLAQSYLSGSLGEMASVEEIERIFKKFDENEMTDLREYHSEYAHALVGKIPKPILEPRGSQFRRVEEQQKVIERYRLALEKIVQFKCVDHEFVWEAERDFLKIIDIATNALKELK